MITCGGGNYTSGVIFSYLFLRGRGGASRGPINISIEPFNVHFFDLNGAGWGVPNRTPPGYASDLHCTQALDTFGNLYSK